MTNETRQKINNLKQPTLLNWFVALSLVAILSTFVGASMLLFLVK